MAKNLLAKQVDASSIPGLGRSPGGGHGNPPQYSYLGNPMDRGAWWATVRGVVESWTRLNDQTTTTFVLSPLLVTRLQAQIAALEAAHQPQNVV